MPETSWTGWMASKKVARLFVQAIHDSPGGAQLVALGCAAPERLVFRWINHALAVYFEDNLAKTQFP